jgi:hypothetical protein
MLGRGPSLLKPPTQLLPFTPSMESIVSTADLRPSTMLHMSDDKEPSGEEEPDIEEILKAIRETTTEGADIAAAEALIKEAGLANRPISQWKPSEEVSIEDLSPCEEAVIDVTANALGLLLTLAGTPSGAGKLAAKKLAKFQVQKNSVEFTKIILSRFVKFDLLNVAVGLVEIMALLLDLTGGIGTIIDAVFGEMTWFQIVVSGAAIIAQLSLIFASGSAYLVVLLAVATTDVLLLVDSAVTVSNKCK